VAIGAKPTIYDDEFAEFEATSLERLPLGVQLLCAEIADDAGISEFDALLMILLIRSLARADSGER
jgi:hypothetical protein